MDWSEIGQDWQRVCESVRQKWPGLHAAELEYLDHTRDALVGKVHERTGLVRDTVERQLDGLIANLPAAQPAKPAVAQPPAGAVAPANAVQVPAVAPPIFEAGPAAAKVEPASPKKAEPSPAKAEPPRHRPQPK